jgi:PmbA protein
MNESELLTRARCREIFGSVEGVARSLGVNQVEVLLGAESEALTRFANSEIHQNVACENRHASIRAVIDQRTARVTTNRLDPDSLAAAVERAVSIARSSEPDDDLLPLYDGAGPAPAADRYCVDTARMTPAGRAQAVGAAIRVVEGASQSAAGAYATGETVEAVLNSAGVFDYHAESDAVFSITATATDSSGWAKASATRRSEFEPEALALAAVEKARRSANPRVVEPGACTVILEPAAVLDLVGQIFGDFSGTALEDQRSCLNERMGRPLFGANITIWDDVYHGLQNGAPFDGEGVPRQRLTLVEGGVPRQLAYGRGAARRQGVPPTGHGYPVPTEIGEAPGNIVIAGGDANIASMIASTAHGVLVTRLWYIRETDPYEKIMTGMTRDGTFLVERGEVVCGIRNLRFNESVIRMLRNVESLSAPVRASGEEAFDMVVPAMKVADFHFTEVTRF